MGTSLTPIKTTNTSKINKKRSYVHLSSLLLTDWPGAKQILENLKTIIEAVNVSDCAKAMEKIIEKSLTAYGSYVYYDKHKHEDLLRLSVFIEVLITETFALLELELINSSSEELVWSSQSKISFALWRIAYENNQLRIIQRHLKSDNNEYLRDSLYRLIVCDKLKSLLKEANYEATIVGSRIDPLY